MEKFLKIVSTGIFIFVVVGFIGLGAYLYLIQEGPKAAVVVPGSGDPAPDSPVMVVDDLLTEAQKKPQTLEEYAYKAEEEPFSWLTILFYLLGGLVGVYGLKKVVQFWNYLVKNSV